MSESKYKELLQHLDSIGWSPDRYGDAQCVDVGSAMAADAIRSLESELDALRSDIARHVQIEAEQASEIEQAYICLTFSGIASPPSLAVGIETLRAERDALEEEVALLKRDIEALSNDNAQPTDDSEIEPQRKAREWKKPE